MIDMRMQDQLMNLIILLQSIWGTIFLDLLKIYLEML
ncbi:hypothetical protein SGRA_3366 [Saprospira grandis str. Lewin]|uniref:Uncharacterized protein n=1 Tax=Saprospira grandis (strain Lewin) TaxID=984262 RepID=H6L157_SAPGL|nr:hypothetical protein SGRA_3366 [Saprospira grandis str. Lewin]